MDPSKRRSRPPQVPQHWGPALIWIALLIAAGVLVAVFLDSGVGIARQIPTSWAHLIKAAVVLIVGGIVSRILERRIFSQSFDKLGAQRSTALRYMTRLLLFVVISVAVLTAFGVGLPSVIFGGTFLTVIIGLAGQTIFSNIVGGLWLIFFRPFHIGDTIGLVAWQYPVLMPSFPHEAMRPLCVGRVLDINLMYTEIMNQDGYPQLIPNGIIAQSFIENRSQIGVRRVRMRFDMANETPPAMFTDRLRGLLAAEFSEEPEFMPEVYVQDIYPTAYSVVVCVYSSEKEDAIRDRVLTHAIDISTALRGQDGKAQLAD